MRRISLILLSILVLPLMFSPNSTSFAQSPSDTDWFCEQTGFFVRDEFLDYYHSTENYLELFGYPITREGTDAMGHRFQYFQKARLDLDPETGKVTSAPLGTYIYTQGEYQAAEFSTSGSLCRMFPNGKTVCYAFLQFYDAKNGEEYLGLPISNTEINHLGYITQFFENGILEWNPDRGTGLKVQVMDLGKYYFDRFGDKSLTVKENGPADFIPEIQRIPQVDVFTSKAIVSANSTEEIFVIVKDQFQQPLPGVNVTILMTYPDGSQSSFRSENTNSDGISSLNIQIGNFEPQDVIQILAVVSANNLETDSVGSTWFRVWW